MTILQRIGYYLAGFSLGLIILAFFFKEKKTDFSYLPDARIKKNISSKKIEFSNQIQSAIINKQIDSITIRQILKNGNVNLSESEPRIEPCAIYIIEGKANNSQINLSVQNCDSIATILNMKIK